MPPTCPLRTASFHLPYPYLHLITSTWSPTLIPHRHTIISAAVEAGLDREDALAFLESGELRDVCTAEFTPVILRRRPIR